MNPMQTTKLVPIAFSEAIVDDDSVTVADVDLKGWDYCQIAFRLGTTDIAMTALKVQESDDDAASDAYADVTGLVVGTSADAYSGSTTSLPGATSDDNFIIFDIDCRKVERYVRLVATFGDGTSGGWGHAFAILSRGENHPQSATERGALNVLRV